MFVELNEIFLNWSYQNHISGFNVRKEKKKEKDAAELIQRNFRGYRRRKQIGFSDTVDVIHAAIRIQKVYRGFQARKKFQAVFKHRIEEDPDSAGSDLPDLNDADVAAATVKIQTAYRGFATRKQLRQVRFHMFFFRLLTFWFFVKFRCWWCVLTRKMVRFCAHRKLIYEPDFSCQITLISKFDHNIKSRSS